MPEELNELNAALIELKARVNESIRNAEHALAKVKKALVEKNPLSIYHQ